MFKRGGICNFLHFPFNFQLFFSYKIVFVKCPCALRPRRLEPNGCRGISVWHFPSTFVYKVVLVRSSLQHSHHFGPVRSLSLWRAANFDIARATLLALWACQIGFAVVRCSFWDGSCNLLVTVGLSGRSRRGAVLILRWLAQPSRRFGFVRSLSLWRGANFDIGCATFWALWACQIALAVARCSFWDGSRNSLVALGLSHRSCCGAMLSGMVTESRWSCTEILTRRSLIQSCPNEFVQSLYRELWERSCTEILPRGLLQISCQKSSYIPTPVKMKFEGRVVLKFHFKKAFSQSKFSMIYIYSTSFHVIGKQMKIKYLRLALEELSACQTEAAHVQGWHLPKIALPSYVRLAPPVC